MATPKLQVNIFISHQDCLNAEPWRVQTHNVGFPPFEPVLHERYDPESIYLKCEACGTVIRHTTRPNNEGIAPS